MDLKRGMIVLLVFLVLFTSACKPLTKDLGTLPNGLSIKFVEDYPPREIVGEEEFQIGIEVKNPLTQMVNFDLCVSGDRSEYFGGIPLRGDCISGSLDESYVSEKNKITPSEEIIFFPSEFTTYFYSNLDENIKDVNVRAELVYPVDSVSSFDVCILGDITLREDEILDCKAKEVLTSSKIIQDSLPLVVSKVEKNIRKVGANNELNLKIYLDKSSEGYILREYDDKIDLIDLEVSLSGTSADFICNSKYDKIIFRKGDPIECKADLGTIENYNYHDTVNLNLRYSYKLVNTKKIIFDTDWFENEEGDII
jgi:hypothetical protein|tara:strand:- start:1012 stop:1941 length:930 start_codon:yes stop_codon:yes gene_type:complete